MPASGIHEQLRAWTISEVVGIGLPNPISFWEGSVTL